jgi:hypothetical protein
LNGRRSRQALPIKKIDTFNRDQGDQNACYPFAIGAKAGSMIVAEQSYETTQPAIDSEIVKLKASGADVFVNLSIPKFAAQAIKKRAEIEWKPLHFLNNVSSSIGATISRPGSKPHRT